MQHVQFSTMKFNLPTDEDTQRLLEIVVEFLQTYFHHPADEALRMVNSFRDRHAATMDDDAYHHLSAYRVAAIVHFVEYLGRNRQDFVEWEREQGLHRVPREAIERFNAAYYVRNQSKHG